MFAGATETMEGGDQLSAGLCPPVVCCQPAWRRTGEVLLLSGGGNMKRPCLIYGAKCAFFSLLEEKISRR